MAVVALSVVSLTGCAHAGLSQAAAASADLNAPVVSAMKAAGTAKGAYAKQGANPIADAMTQAAGAYTKEAQ
jgi:hypothetical protein